MFNSRTTKGFIFFDQKINFYDFGKIENSPQNPGNGFELFVYLPMAKNIFFGYYTGRAKNTSADKKE